MKRLVGLLAVLLALATCFSSCVRKSDSPQENEAPKIEASQETIDLVDQIFSVDNYLVMCQLTTMSYEGKKGHIETYAEIGLSDLEESVDAAQALLLKYLETPVLIEAISEEELEQQRAAGDYLFLWNYFMGNDNWKNSI